MRSKKGLFAGLMMLGMSVACMMGASVVAEEYYGEYYDDGQYYDEGYYDEGYYDEGDYNEYEEPAEEKDGDNSLSSLGLSSEYQCSPEFAYNHLEYDITVPAGTTRFEVDPVRSSSKAEITNVTDISEEDIIRIYGKRWQTEVFYKTCKSWLNLGKECHGLSYDALTAHVSLVFARYMLLSVEQRKSDDPRSLCELFYILCDELSDITYDESLRIIMEAMLETIRQFFHITEEQLDDFATNFVNRLPKYLQISLGYKSLSA